MMSKIEKIKSVTKKSNSFKKNIAKKKNDPKTTETEELSNEQLHTIIKKLTAELDQTKMQLDQFAHTSSHELQEPLRKITTFSRYLLDEDKSRSPAMIKTYLNKLEAASIRMTKLIQDMLHFTLITNYDKLFVETDLNEVLKSVVFDLELLIDEKNVKVKFPRLNFIEAVPFQMHQLFYGIMHNAIKFSRPDMVPTIKIKARILPRSDLKLHSDLDQNLKYYEISIKDNGIGFDQQYAQQIFTMFQRLSAGGDYPGTGIGLAICQKIAHTHNGAIFAEGIEEEGTTIRILLPIQQPKKLPEDETTILKTWL